MKDNMFKKIAFNAVVLTAFAAVSAFSASVAKADETATSIDLDTFIKAVVAADYNFDGSKHDSAKGGVLTVKWSPVSGCRNNLANHTCTVDGVAATGNTPMRVNSHLAQFQLFEKITSAVSVKNVAFVYEPADFTICANSGWAGSGTAEDVRAGQLYLMNTGDVTFKDCTFDKVVLTSFNCTGTSTATNCSFKNVYNSYAVKDFRGVNVSVTDCTFENCGAAIMLSGVGATDTANKVNQVTISGNTFTKVDVTDTAPADKVGTRGIIQIASSGDYSETTFDFSNNTATDCGPVLRQLNKTVTLDATAKTNLNNLITDGASLYTEDTIGVCAVVDGVMGYDTLEAALAAVDEGKPLTSVTEAAWPVATPVYYNGTFYAKDGSKGALELAIDAANEANSSDVAKIYVRPGFTADELVLQAHQNLKTSLAIYGNDAQLSRAWGPCIEYTTGNAAFHQLTKDVSISIYNLHKGAGVWGARVTDYTVDITLADCQDAYEIMINGSLAQTSVNNYTIKRCTFDGTSMANTGGTVVSTSAGKIVVEDCTFANLAQSYVINPNNKNGGAMEVVVKNTAFTNCGKSGVAVIRVAGEKEGTSATVTLDSLTFDDASAPYAIAFGKKELNENNADITYTITNTAGTLSVFEKGGTAETITATTTTLVATETYEGANFAAVAKIGDEEYWTLADAFAAATEGQTVKLLADLTETDAEDSRIVYDMPGVTLDLNGHTYSHYNFAHVFEGTGGVIKNGKMVCLNGGSYALFIGDDKETTSFTVENVEMEGGVNIHCAQGVVLKELSVKAQNYYAVWLECASEATVESGTYASAEVSVGGSLFNVSEDENGGVKYKSVLTLAGGTFKTIGNSLMGSSGGTLVVTGGKFDQDLDTGEEKAYLASGLTTIYSESEKLYIVAAEKSELVTVNTTTEAGTTETKTVEVALTEDVIKAALTKAGVDTGTTDSTAKVEALNKEDTNGNPVWVNIVAGIESDKSVAVDAAQNTDAATIDVTPVNIGTVASGTGVQIAYEVDEVTLSTSDGKQTATVEKQGDAVSAAAIDVDNVETSAYFQVKVLVRQNGSTIASVPATNYIGVLKKSTKATKALVPVPWHSLADGGDISVSNVVKTANLTAGDTLSVYVAAEKKYNVYELKADKTWEPKTVYKIDANGQISTTETETPDTMSIPRGSGVWLERQDPNTPIVTYGLASATKQTTTIAKATQAEDGTVTKAWSLAAVPTTESVALSTLAEPDKATEDKVIVPTEGAPIVYTVKDGAWGYDETVTITDSNGNATGIVTTERKTDATLPAGTGFWYVNGSTDEKSVEW